MWCILCGIICSAWCGVCDLWRVRGGAWCVVCGVWCAVSGLWRLLCGVWCVVCFAPAVWCVVCNNRHFQGVAPQYNLPKKFADSGPLILKHFGILDMAIFAKLWHVLILDMATNCHV